MDYQTIVDIEAKYGANNYAPLENVVIERGEGVWVYDIDGKKYLDCLSAYSAVSQGHCHPRLIKALTEQAQRLTLTSRAFRNVRYPSFIKRLHEVTGYDKALPMNSGVEAVETAIKMARKWAYQKKGVPLDQAEIIMTEGNFHGRTITVISGSTEPEYRDFFGPYTPGFVIVRFGDAEAIEAAITPNTAAVLIEPIQGEGGVNIPPDGYLRQVRGICSRHRVLFMADEIQVGLGRTGKLFACDHEDVRPDVMILGKALSGGFYPVSAALADANVMGVFEPGSHGSTFGGNPLACAVAQEALDIILDEHLAENAAAVGDYFQERLAEIPSPHIKEVRGRGLLIGVEVTESAGGAYRFCEALRDRGILCKDTHETVIRFAPPLIIDRETIDWALPRIADVMNMP